jgi:hypothetical protein
MAGTEAASAAFASAAANFNPLTVGDLSVIQGRTDSSGNPDGLTYLADWLEMEIDVAGPSPET